MAGPMISRRSALAGSLALSGALAFTPRAKAAESLTYIQSDDGRRVRVSIWPATTIKRGSILFSHGNESCPEKYLRVITPWAESGFDVLAPLHVDSTEHDEHGKRGLMEGWRARLSDMRALSAFVGTPYVAAGHSYGGLVALTLGGALPRVPPGLTAPMRDPRAKCVLALSPTGISPGFIDPGAYKSIGVPALIQSGTRDVLPRSVKDPRWHLAAYDEAPPGDKYSLMLDGVDHWFGGLICEPTQPGPPEEAQLAALNALSIDFLAAYGAGDPKALAALTAALTDAGPTRLTRK